MHVRQLPSGKWRVIVQHQGRRRDGTADTKPEAIQLGARLLVELGGRRDARAVTIGEAIVTYLRQTEMSSTTAADYRSVAVRLPEWFTDRPASELDVLDVEHLYRHLGEAGWSAHRIHRVFNLLSPAFALCERYGWATHNPARAARRPERPRHEITPPTAEQVTAVLAAAPEAFVLFLRLAANTGARRGELVGMQWGDVNLERAQVLICRSLVYTPASGVEERATKTGRRGHRLIAVGLPTVAALRQHHREQRQVALEHGLPTPRWVFSHDGGVTPWRPDYATHCFAHARRAAGVDGVRLHDLRHFVATQLLDSGESLVQVAARLGHASTTTTADIYAHWMPNKDAAAAERLDGLIGG